MRLKSFSKNKIISVLIIFAVIVICILTILGSKSSRIYGGENSQRIEFLKSFGWRVSDEVVDIQEVQIPSHFSATYKNYNEIQLSQGFDLSKYRTDIVKRYTYTVYNYPDGKGGALKNIYANILVLDEQIIGGDVCSTALGGFIHGFSLSAGNANASGWFVVI